MTRIKIKNQLLLIRVTILTGIKIPSIINSRKMNKTAQTEWVRVFLIEALPEPLNPVTTTS